MVAELMGIKVDDLVVMREGKCNDILYVKSLKKTGQRRERTTFDVGIAQVGSTSILSATPVWVDIDSIRKATGLELRSRARQ